MSDADTLRRAAALMRERAKAATPGSWHVPRKGSGIDAGEYDTVIGPGPVDCMAYCYGGSSTIDGDNLVPDQAHIASWHPAVALAVADWLDAAGADLWAHGPLHCALGCAECDDDLWMPHARRALAVATTYLGESA